MILLDTDTFALFSYGHAGIAQKIEERHAETLSVTLITRMEVLRGRFESILKAADDEELTKAVGRFLESVLV